MEHHHVQWVNPVFVAMFNSYVKVPEGIPYKFAGGNHDLKNILSSNIPSSNNIYSRVICYSLLVKIAIEIVELPIDSMVIFHSYVKLPEGNMTCHE